MARKTRNDQIAAIELEMGQLEAQKKKLLAEQKEADQKARTNRLCKRHGLFESMLPDAITLTEDNFKAFLQKTVANDYWRKMLASLLAEQERNAAANGDNAVKAVEPAVVANAVNTAQTAQKPSVITPQTAVKTAS
jgi:chromosome segregation ATPase